MASSAGAPSPAPRVRRSRRPALPCTPRSHGLVTDLLGSVEGRSRCFPRDVPHSRTSSQSSEGPGSPGPFVCLSSERLVRGRPPLGRLALGFLRRLQRALGLAPALCRLAFLGPRRL